MADNLQEVSSVAGVVYGLHAGDNLIRYIGLSIEPDKRLKAHRNRAASGYNLPVCDWMRKHGPENIQMEIIETFDEDSLDQMNQRECELIEEYGTYFHSGNGGLNYTTGGEGTRGHKMSEEEKARRSELMKGKGLFEGRSHTESSRGKMRIAKLGVTLSEEHRQKISENNAWAGKVYSPEEKKAMSERQKGKPNRGLHTRWCVNAGKPRPDCTFCAEA